MVHPARTVGRRGRPAGAPGCGGDMEHEETLAPGEGPGGAGWLLGLRHRLLPKWAGNGREAFQLRFLVGACLLAAPVAALSLLLTVTQGATLETGVLGAFLAAIALFLAIRRTKYSTVLLDRAARASIEVRDQP